MKNITQYINESINKHNIFKNIDVNDFKWHSSYSDKDYQNKCKEEVKKFADELYKDLKPYKRIEELFRDSYKQFLSTNQSWSQQKIDDQYNDQIKIIDKYNWVQFENNSLEQGWWVFMHWVKKHN